MNSKLSLSTVKIRLLRSTWAAVRVNAIISHSDLSDSIFDRYRSGCFSSVRCSHSLFHTQARARARARARTCVRPFRACQCVRLSFARIDDRRRFVPGSQARRFLGSKTTRKRMPDARWFAKKSGAVRACSGGQGSIVNCAKRAKQLCTN